MLTPVPAAFSMPSMLSTGDPLRVGTSIEFELDRPARSVMEGCEDAIVEEDVGEPAGHGTRNSGSRGLSGPAWDGNIGARSIGSLAVRWPASKLAGEEERRLVPLQLPFACAVTVMMHPISRPIGGCDRLQVSCSAALAL